MKLNILIMLLLLNMLYINEVFAADGTTTLLQSIAVAEGEPTKLIEAELSPLLRDNSKAKGAKLIGKMQVTKKQDKAIIQFLFGGVETKNPKKKGKREVVLLKQPIVGAGICKDASISQEDLITLQYTEEELTKALEDLLKGQNLATQPKKFQGTNPTGVLTERSDVATSSVSNSKTKALSEGLAAAQSFAGMQLPGRSGVGVPADLLTQEQGSRQTDPIREHTAKGGVTSSGGGVGRGSAATGKGAGVDLPSMFGDLRRAADPTIRTGEPDKKPDPAKLEHTPLTAAKTELPKIEIKTTADGCSPRVDRVHNKVIMQEKTITLENGRVKETSRCEDTLEQYDIFKDYLCPGCEPTVDVSRRVAFDKYKAFWVNADNTKIVLDESPQVDLTEPHPFIDEGHGCGFEIDDVAGMAYPKAATIFADRFNGKHVVQACHRIADAVGIRLTDADCPIEHDFAGSRSFLRKKKVFIVDGAEHIAHDCARLGDPIPHEFVTSVCQSIVDPHTQAITPLARRRITTSTGKQFITECEPLADTNLIATTEGCEENLFTHDFVSGRSYFNKRYYYNGPAGRVYCTDCIRSAEMVPHELEAAGLQHDDSRHVSYPKTTTFLTYRLQGGEQQRIKIEEPRVLPTATTLAHVLVNTENRPNGAGIYQGCHKVTQSQIIQNYKRSDNSTYEIVAGLGTPVQGPDECRYELIIDPPSIYMGPDLISDIPVYVTVTIQTFKIYPGSGRKERVYMTNLNETLLFKSYGYLHVHIQEHVFTYICPVSGITKRFKLYCPHYSTSTGLVQKTQVIIVE